MESNNENLIKKGQPIRTNYKVLRKMFKESREKVQYEMSKSASGKSVHENGMPEETKKALLIDDEPPMESITMGNEMRANYNEYILSGGDNCLYPESDCAGSSGIPCLYLVQSNAEGYADVLYQNAKETYRYL